MRLTHKPFSLFEIAFSGASLCLHLNNKCPTALPFTPDVQNLHYFAPRPTKLWTGTLFHPSVGTPVTNHTWFLPKRWPLVYSDFVPKWTWLMAEQHWCCGATGLAPFIPIKWPMTVEGVWRWACCQRLAAATSTSSLFLLIPGLLFAQSSSLSKMPVGH